MDIVLKNAYREVNQIIELLGEEYKSKIPPKVLQFFNEKQNINYKPNISKDIPIEKIQLSRNALIIISILNLRYWETDEAKKCELKRIYNENETNYQEKINIYKKNDWLESKKNDISKEEKKENIELVERNKSSFIEKIKKYLKNILSFIRKRENK